MKTDNVRIWYGSNGCPFISASYCKQEFTRHYHEHFVIGLNLSGCHQSYFRGNTLLLPSNNIIVIEPGEIHSGKSACKQPWIYRAIYPSVDQLRTILEIPEQSIPGFPKPVIDDNELVNIFIHLHKLLEKKACDLEIEYWQQYFYQLLVKRHSDFNYKEEACTMPASIKLVKEYLLDYYYRAISLDELALLASINKFHLIKSFKTYTGLTPHAFQNQIKIEKAKQLIKQKQDLAMIAYDLGFTDQAHFSKWFKKIIGITPGQYS